MGKIDLGLARRAIARAPTPGSPAIRQLVDAIAAGAEARDRRAAPTNDAIDLIRQAKLGTYRLPVAEGGGGASLRELFELVIDLAAADSNIPHILRNHFNFVERAIRTQHDPRFGRWLEHVREGRLFGSGSSELGTQNIGGKDFGTRLDPAGDGYVLNGNKYYSTGNYYSDFILVSASAWDGRGVSALIGTRQDGVGVEDDWDGIGQRLTASGTTTLRDVVVDKDDVIFSDDPSVGLPYSATFAQLYLTAIISGILRNIVTDASALVKGRGRNYYHAVAAVPGEDPFVQQTIGKLSAIAYVAESSVLRAAELLGEAFHSAAAGKPDVDLFREAALRAAKSKVVIDELALTAATQLFDAGGASAAKQSARLDRHWRNIRTISSHNPLSYKARVIGDNLLNGAPLPTGAFF